MTTRTPRQIPQQTSQRTPRAVAVLGAAGQTGGRVARRLLQAGVAVRAFGRAAERLQALERLGATAVCGDAADPDALARLFEGADAAYALSPFDPAQSGYRRQQDRQGDALARAAVLSGLPRMVFLSSLGADAATGTGVIEALHGHEQRLLGVRGLELLRLRPGGFFEAVLPLLPAMRATGVWVDTVDPERAYPMVATADVGDAAVAVLLNPQASHWQSGVLEVPGPRDRSHADLARLLGPAIGRPDLVAQYLPPATLQAILVEAGIAPDLAELLAQFGEAISNGTIAARQGRGVQTPPPTEFEAWLPSALAVSSAG